MGKLSITKGKTFERLVANAFKAVWPRARRGYQSRSGKEMCDVEGTPYHVECKRMSKVRIQKAYEQALLDTDGRAIVVVSKEDRGPILVTMDLDSWLELVK